jgi:hypothetical protein
MYWCAVVGTLAHQEIDLTLAVEGFTVKEKLLIRVAWMLPRKLAYWCAVRVMSHATVGEYSHQIVPELTAMEALQRW